MFYLILLYLVLTIIRPQDYLPGLENVPVLPPVLALAFLAWLLSRQKTWDAPQFLLLPAFLLVLMLSQVSNGWAGGMVAELARFGPAVVAFFVFAAACTDRRHVVISMRVFVVCALILALHGIEQAQTGVGWTGVPLGDEGRIQYVGIFNDPNDLGLLFVATLPMAMYLAHRAGALMKLFWWACAAAILYGVYLTNSRGALLAVLVVAGIYIWHKRGLFLAGSLGVIGLIGMQLLSSRMTELDAGEESANGRVEAWYEGLHMFLENPVFGVGPGSFTDYNDLTAHNSFVLVLAETGFVGYIIWLAFVGYCFWMMLSVMRYAYPPTQDPVQVRAAQEEKRMALTLLLSLCGLFGAAFFLSRSYMIVLYLIAAMVTGYYVGARQRMPDLPHFSLAASWWRWVPASMGSITALYLLVAILLRTAK